MFGGIGPSKRRNHGICRMNRPWSQKKTVTPAPSFRRRQGVSNPGSPGFPITFRTGPHLYFRSMTDELVCAAVPTKHENQSAEGGPASVPHAPIGLSPRARDIGIAAHAVLDAGGCSFLF